MRTLFVGDVHGCVDELSRLLALCAFNPKADRLVLVGDLVAKGPDSAGVIQLAREQGALAVRGNHDAQVLRWYAGQGPEGKKPKPEHRAVLDALRDEDWAFLKATPLYRRFPELNVLALHGGLIPGVPVESQREVDLLNLRSILEDGTPSTRGGVGRPWASLWQGPETVIFGHDALRGLQRHPFAMGLDTGCVYGRSLTAYVLPEGQLFSVPSRRAYVTLD